jgi:hypothetical protein
LKLSTARSIGHSLPENRWAFAPLFEMGLRGTLMHRNVALLTRLEHIAARQGPCEERTEHALTLVKADIARLYACLGIGASNRIDSRAKIFADDRLSDLRSRVLTAEVRTPAPSRPVFTAVRHRIEMIRRVLASHIAEDPVAAAPSTTDKRRPAPAADPYSVNRGWRYIPAKGSVAAGQQPIADGNTASAKPADPLECHVLRYAPRLTNEDSHGARRARFGSLSGQLTM